MKHVKLFEQFINEASDKLFEATVEMDAMDPTDKDFLKFLKKNKVKITNTEMDGPGGGTPVITMQGKRKDLEAVLADEEFGWADADLAEYIEESLVAEARGLELDKDLAEISLRKLVESSGDKKFSEEVYFSAFERDDIARQYGSKLPRGFAGPTKMMHISNVLKPLVGNSVYMDGGDLVLGDKTVSGFKYGKSTLNDVLKLLKIKL